MAWLVDYWCHEGGSSSLEDILRINPGFGNDCILLEVPLYFSRSRDTGVDNDLRGVAMCRRSRPLDLHATDLIDI